MMIKVNNLTFSYPGQHDHLFDGFNLTLQENRVYGLLGKNGTGKSTLLYLLSGLLRPKGGTVDVDGFTPHLRKAEMLQDLFIVPEEYDLPAVQLSKYVKLTAPFYPRFSHEVLKACLGEFEMEGNPNLGRLSMGQKKKVYMSLAMAAGTKLLLMDEPTNGLDIPSKSQFRKVVAQQMGEGRTLIISTHQVHDVETLLDHVLILNQRELLLDSSVDDLTSRYSFGIRMPGDMDGVLYAEPSLQGNMTMALRKADEPESLLNLELLFNAVTKGLVK